MLPATPQRTAETRLPAPAPITPPAITWVVESGKPKCEEARITAAPAPWAENPWAGVHLDDPRAHRPDDPPAAGVGAERDRGGGGDDHPGRRVGRRGEVAVGDQRQGDHAHRLLRVVGAVREREQAAGDDLAEAEPAGHRARPLAADDPVADRRSRWPPTTNASTGAITAGIRTLPTTPSPSTASAPAAANAAPTTPPISACDELDGSPKYQVIRFQAIAPTRPGEDDRRRDRAGVDDVLGDRRRDRERDERAGEVEDRRVADRDAAAASPGSRSRSRRRWRCRGSRW